MTQTDVFDCPKPALSADTIARHLEADFGIRAELRSLVSERDLNLRICGNQTGVLKISNGAESIAFLELQNAVLKHIEAVDPKLGVPRVQSARDGRQIVHWTDADQTHAVRVLSWLPGQLLSSVVRTSETLHSLGDFLGRLSSALQGFGHPAAHRKGFIWSLDEALLCEPWLEDVNLDVRESLRAIFQRYRARVLPRLAHLRAAVVHQDGNDNNVLVADDDAQQVVALIDFGDLSYGRQINELAVALAYALMDVDDIFVAARSMIAGYTQQFPIQTDEADVLFDLVATRLAVSVCISSHRSKAHPDNEYLRISQAPALRLIARLESINPEFFAAFARDAAGLEVCASAASICTWLDSPACHPQPLFDFSLDRSARMLLSLKQDAPGMHLASDPLAHSAWVQQQLHEHEAIFAIGLYGEDRGVGTYSSAQFASAASPERRTQHLGVDLFVPADTALHAPLAGRVLSVVDNAQDFDYGPTVILEHQAGEGGPLFWTLYGHLSRRTLECLQPGQLVAAGQCIGWIGAAHENGGWAPHLHLQLIADRLNQSGDFPGACQPSLWPIWKKLCPHPNHLLRLVPESFEVDPNPPEQLLARRQQSLAPSLSTSYAKKLKIVRGRGTWLYDHTGRAFLDGVNNICHVGHAHPQVVEALAQQASVLNTNTRYLHDLILQYSERLTRTFPDPLRVMYLVCSGSEANELALRIARTITRRHHTIALDWGYHGNTNAAIEVSAYKFNRKGGQGQPAHVQLATLPDPYRGAHRSYAVEAGIAYAQSVAEKIDIIQQQTGHGPAAFIAEAISGCGGQVVFPDGYLRAAAASVRAAGGLVIVDEVQTGFGRVGEHFWAHHAQGVVPDIVTIGKPIGNGHPMAAVITTPAIAHAFANGMEFFSSFGGNPVSCAVGMAVLDVLEQEDLQRKAAQTGDYLKSAILDLAKEHALIGDVRGSGLFLGVDLVTDHHTREHATLAASKVINHMRDNGVLLSTDGPMDNVLKIKPPLCFGPPEADLMLTALDQALRAAQI